MINSTAGLAAMTRASHRVLDDKPWILDDWLAGPLAGLPDDTSVAEAIREHEAELTKLFSPERARAFTEVSRAGSILRSRIAEDRLAEAVARGVKQFVLLGAGLDSTPYRRPDLIEGIKVFELDLIEHQTDKRERLAACNVTVPDNVVFAPIDFEKDTIVGALSKHEFNPDERAFFSWLGVVAFLSREAVFDTLGQIARMAPGTEIVFEHQVPEKYLNEADRNHMESVRVISELRGEPLKDLLDPAEISAGMKELGFTEVEALDFKEGEQRYFAGRTDRLRMPSRLNFVWGRTGG